MKGPFRYDGTYFKWRLRDWFFSKEVLVCGCIVYGFGPVHIQLRHELGCYYWEAGH